MVHRLAAANAVEDGIDVLLVLERHEHRDVVPDDLGGGVAEEVRFRRRGSSS